LAFHGTFEHTLDAKNRVTVPSKFRTALSDGVFLVRGEDPCLLVYRREDYTSLAERSLAGTNPLSRAAKDARRLFFAFADDIELDSAGRLTLAAKHLQHAGIDGREIVITGTGEALELWNPERWRSYEADLLARASDLTGNLGHPA
jgi:MraZ protein